MKRILGIKIGGVLTNHIATVGGAKCHGIVGVDIGKVLSDMFEAVDKIIVRTPTLFRKLELATVT